MEKSEIEEICKSRLELWRQDLVREHSTPVVLVAIGHDHRSGHVLVIVPEGVRNEDVILFLQKAVQDLELKETLPFLKG